mmetsp:Transcript_51876/g.70734  ORF Transcript_51876/g.70734 Transcript_51876/m.70734 type:complete len:851 (+) Transcript_51876:2-2554(+)
MNISSDVEGCTPVMDEMDECTQMSPTPDLLTQSEVDTPKSKTHNVPEPWGRLMPMAQNKPIIYLQPRESDNTVLNEYFLGRGKDCDVEVPDDKKKVSSRHCRVWCEKRGNGANMGVFIEDQSQNGTWIDHMKLIKFDRREIHSGDEISLLDPRKDETNRVAACSFTFKSLQNRQIPQMQVTSAHEKNVNEASLSDRVETFYDIRDVIGKGQCGEVHRAIERKTGKAWAVKIIQVKKFGFGAGCSSPQQLMQEAEMMRAVSHPHIINLHEVFGTRDAIHLVMELVEGGDLLDRILEQGPYPEASARKLMRAILSAVDYLHRTSIVHRDLKPENILLVNKTSDINVKITDFGLAKRVEAEGLKTFCGTPQYFAPEVLKRQGTVFGAGRYGYEADMWSMGVILYVVLTGTQPFNDATLFAQIQNADFRMDGEEWAGISTAAKRLVSSMLTKCPKKRLTASQALNHPWVATDDPVLELPPPPPRLPSQDDRQTRTDKHSNHQSQHDPSRKTGDRHPYLSREQGQKRVDGALMSDQLSFSADPLSHRPAWQAGPSMGKRTVGGASGGRSSRRGKHMHTRPVLALQAFSQPPSKQPPRVTTAQQPSSSKTPTSTNVEGSASEEQRPPTKLLQGHLRTRTPPQDSPMSSLHTPPGMKGGVHNSITPGKPTNHNADSRAAKNDDDQGSGGVVSAQNRILMARYAGVGLRDDVTVDEREGALTIANDEDDISEYSSEGENDSVLIASSSKGGKKRSLNEGGAGVASSSRKSYVQTSHRGGAMPSGAMAAERNCSNNVRSRHRLSEAHTASDTRSQKQRYQEGGQRCLNDVLGKHGHESVEPAVGNNSASPESCDMTEKA